MTDYWQYSAREFLRTFISDDAASLDHWVGKLESLVAQGFPPPANGFDYGPLADRIGQPRHPMPNPLRLIDLAHAWLDRHKMLANLQSTAKPPSATDHYVTLKQMAGMISLGKRSLERWVTNGTIPMPDVEGGAGKANLWKWSTVRPILQRESGITLPEIFPASQRL